MAPRSRRRHGRLARRPKAERVLRARLGQLGRASNRSRRGMDARSISSSSPETSSERRAMQVHDRAAGGRERAHPSPPTASGKPQQEPSTERQRGRRHGKDYEGVGERRVINTRESSQFVELIAPAPGLLIRKGKAFARCAVQRNHASPAMNRFNLAVSQRSGVAPQGSGHSTCACNAWHSVATGLARTEDIRSSSS